MIYSNTRLQYNALWGHFGLRYKLQTKTFEGLEQSYYTSNALTH